MQTGVKSLGCENRTAQPSPIQSWKLDRTLGSVRLEVGGLVADTQRHLLSPMKSGPGFWGFYPRLVNERWGEDPKLVALLGEQGAAGFRALFDGFPELVGVLWALRDADGRIEDFAFGYGNPSIMRSFRIPPETRDRYTLLEALPRMRDSRAFDAYVRTCDDGEPWVKEITYDTPVRGRLHARHVRPPHRQARRRADGVPHRRHRAAAHGGRAARLRRRRRPRPARAGGEHGAAGQAARARRRAAAARRRCSRCCATASDARRS